jgi:hypothetical protein
MMRSQLLANALDLNADVSAHGRHPPKYSNTPFFLVSVAAPFFGRGACLWLSEELFDRQMIFDWTDACIAHPFVDVGTLLYIFVRRQPTRTPATV